jgi:hypothetical protein
LCSGGCLTCLKIGCACCFSRIASNVRSISGFIFCFAGFGLFVSFSVNLKFWFARWESLEIKNGMLCMFWDDGVRSARWKICAPKSTLQTILWYLHDTKTASVAILSKGTPTRYDFKKWRFLLGGFFALSTHFTLIKIALSRLLHILPK